MLAPLLLLTLPLAQAADPRLGTIEERARRFNETLETCGAEGSAGVVVTLYPPEEPRTFSSGSSHAQEFAEMLQSRWRRRRRLQSGEEGAAPIVTHTYSRVLDGLAVQQLDAEELADLMADTEVERVEANCRLRLDDPDELGDASPLPDDLVIGNSGGVRAVGEMQTRGYTHIPHKPRSPTQQHIAPCARRDGRSMGARPHRLGHRARWLVQLRHGDRCSSACLCSGAGLQPTAASPDGIHRP